MAARRVASALLFVWLVLVAAVALASPVSPDAFPGANGKIAFVRASGDDEDPEHIWVMDNDGSNAVQITHGEVWDLRPRWSPDGTKILFERRHDPDGDAQLFVMDADGSNVTQLTSGAEAVEGTWSPDGTKIAYSTTPNPNTGEERALFVMDADGSNVTQLTFDNRNDAGPSWSPDGSLIAFSRIDPDSGDAEIFTVNADGTNPVQVTDSDGAAASYNPIWSPDGTQLVFTRMSGFFWVYRMDADGSDQVELAGPTADWASWSPDGTLITFVDFSDPDASGIWTMSPGGTGAEPLYTTGAVFAPSWQRLDEPEPPTSTTSPTTTSRPSDGERTAPRFTG